MIYHQTDNIFPVEINKYGCLFFSLMEIAEKYTGEFFHKNQILKLYYDLVDLRIMRKDCYVNNHEKVLQQALEVFHNHDKVTYVGAWYNDYMSKRKSFGQRYGMYMILQFKTKNGNGHFRRPSYDPYQPTIVFTNLISIRYYNIGV